MASTSTPITSVTAQLAAHDSPKAGPQDDRTKPAPTGQQLDHPALYPKGGRMANDIRRRLPARPDAAQPEAAAAVSKNDHAVKPLLDEQAYINFLPTSEKQDKFTGLLDTLRALVNEHGDHAKRDQTPPIQTTRNDIEAATALNGECLKNLREGLKDAPEKITKLAKNFVNIAHLLKSAFEAFQSNRALQSGLKNAVRARL